LKDFVANAGQRGIVVEVCFYNAQYRDTWPLSPLCYGNNIQDVGRCDFRDAQTLKHPDLVKRLDAYVGEITTAVNSFDNVILEICDEPFLTGTPIEPAGEWLRHNLEVILRTESGLPKRHLVAQQVEGLNGPCDLSDDPGISLLVAQYAWYGSFDQIGGLMMLDWKYDRNKPIELNETSYYPVWYAGDKVADSRVEAWEFITGGGAGFNQLNGRFTVADPAGNTPDNHQILSALRNLKDFIYSFDFLKMRPDRSMVVRGMPKRAIWRGMSEPGKQYAVYLHHSILRHGENYVVLPGNYQHELVLRLPPGTYQADWVDPATGKVLRTDRLPNQHDDQTLATPPYPVDIALRVKRID
jgi:hypothetical protein